MICQMDNISTTHDSNPEVLESYFTKYPDVPKETILKQHLLNLGHWFSDAALEAAAGALFKLFCFLSYGLVPVAPVKRGAQMPDSDHFAPINGPHTIRPGSH